MFIGLLFYISIYRGRQSKCNGSSTQYLLDTQVFWHYKIQSQNVYDSKTGN